MTDQTEAPERSYTEDELQAAVAAALGEAGNLRVKIYYDAFEQPATMVGNAVEKYRQAVRALPRADALAALDRVKADERERCAVRLEICAGNLYGNAAEVCAVRSALLEGAAAIRAEAEKP